VKIFARYDLAASTLQTDEPALLLEGNWPAGAQSSRRWSLDEWIDARHAWIDREASRLAERATHGPSGEITLTYLNVLPLRYYLVKLLRVIAAFAKTELQAAESLELHLARGRDEDYADVIGELTEQGACKIQIYWHDGWLPRKQSPPHNALWRRWAARISQWTQTATQNIDRDRRNVVLCGNPRILNPVCAELVGRGTRVWWLYDRFAVGAWRQWRRAGVGQLVCNSSLGRTHLFSDGFSPTRLLSRNVDLTRPVDRWLNRLAGEVGAAQSRLLEQVDLHFEQIRPDALVIDEDATPLPRAAVAVSRRMGIESTVVQHGVPCVQFGFAPLAADRICAWDAGSQRQLERWEIPSDRIVVTGSSQESALQPLEQQRSQGSKTPGPRLLLLATVPPRDDRPEPATFHLTRQTYAEMLRIACAAAARIPGAKVVVKLHPRAQDPSHIQQAAAEFPALSFQIASAQSLRQLLSGCDCVLSCVSSSGIEAASVGLPVIQLLPVGSGDVLPAEDFGLVGSACTQEELDALLDRTLASPRGLIQKTKNSFGVERIIEVILNVDSQPEVSEPNSLATAIA
jgi:hypothetical protein